MAEEGIKPLPMADLWGTPAEWQLLFIGAPGQGTGVAWKAPLKGGYLWGQGLEEGP